MNRINSRRPGAGALLALCALVFAAPILLRGGAAAAPPGALAARFGGAVLGVLIVGIAVLAGTHWKNSRTGIVAGAILASSPLFFACTQASPLALAGTFWTTLALYAVSRILQERAPEKIRRHADVLAVAMGGGWMTHGFWALCLPVVLLWGVLIYTRLGLQSRRVSWPRVALGVLLVAVPGMLAAGWRPTLWPRDGIFESAAPARAMLAAVLIGFLPWSAFLPKVISQSLRHRRAEMKRDPARALWVFSGVFILTGSALPLIPPMALLAAAALEEAWDQDATPNWLHRGVVGIIGVWMLFLVLIKVAPGSIGAWSAGALPQGWNDPAALALAGGIFILVGVWGMRRSAASFAGLLLAQGILLGVLTSGSPEFVTLFLQSLHVRVTQYHYS